VSARDELAAAPEGTRGGEDARRRGWFWHWNALVTQYAPLIGLKGVGLLNSYTVWTDRREESPHRGYAFPSQQREADFYGEDRAELITINKILVVLDLIEIRKELVPRTDPQGRRWKVPHNFYRVKDHDDGFGLRAGDVLRVAALAERDKAVYRYLRRVFSPRFAPIDEGNPWHAILAEVRQHPTWDRLAARAAAEEDRASARTRAGHAARKGARPEPVAAAPVAADLFVPASGDDEAGPRVDFDSTGGATQPGDETIVGPINTGSDPAVDGSNNGSDRSGPTGVGRSSRPQPAVVAPTNTTYDQSSPTTTRRGDQPDLAARSPEASDVAAASGAARRVGMATAGDEPTSPEPEPLPIHDPMAAPGDGPGRAAAIRAFEEANAREATPAERRLLAGLAERFEPAAAAVGASGWGWLAAAIYEAVEAGSRFVAPRRAREILARWEREGCPQTDDGRASERVADNSSSASRRVAPAAGVGGQAEMEGEGTAGAARFGGQADGAAGMRLGDRAAGRAGGDAALGARSGPPRSQPATAGATLPAIGLVPELAPQLALELAPEPEPFVVAECGLASPAVWSAVLAAVAAGGAVSPAEFAAWVKPTILLGRGEDGADVGARTEAGPGAELGPGSGSALVVGASHPAARRRIEARHLPALRAAAAAVLGQVVAVEVVVSREWLLRAKTAAPPAAAEPDDPAPRRAVG
jgi:hypothetical protein